jgi:hypothetical protein
MNRVLTNGIEALLNFKIRNYIISKIETCQNYFECMSAGFEENIIYTRFPRVHTQDSNTILI